MQNRKQIILETVANLLMEMNPETYLSAANKAIERSDAYRTIQTSGAFTNVGKPYRFTKRMPPIGKPFSPLYQVDEPRDLAREKREAMIPYGDGYSVHSPSKEEVDDEFSGIRPVRGVRDLVTREPQTVPKGRKGNVTGFGNPTQRKQAEDHRGYRLAIKGLELLGYLPRR